MSFNTRYIGEYQTEIWRDLKGSVTLWSSTEMTRCVERAVDDLSRHYPLEAIYEYTIDYEVSGEGSTAPAVGTWKDLANKPIKPNSETVTSDPAGTTYARDTDYTMDYANGRYIIISSGSISENNKLLFTYTKSRLGIDISAIISDLIRVVGVEYPVDKVPQQFVSYHIFNDFMFVGSQRSGESQTLLTNKEHVAIHYEKPHTAPLAAAAPSYPAFLDQVVCIGAGAYALLVKAIQYEHQSVTDLASSRTSIGNIAAIHTLTDAALDKVSTYGADADTALDAAVTQLALIATALDKIDAGGQPNLADADTALDAAIVQIVAAATALAKVDAGAMPCLTDADTALDAFISAIADAPTALAKVDTYLAGASESTKALLALITTDAAGLRTAIATALTAAKAYLDEVDTTDLQGAEAVWAEEVKHILTDANIPNAEDFLESGDDSIDISSILSDVEDALDKIATEIAAGKTYLTDGEPKIDKVNIGDNVPELQRDYANVQNALAAGYRQEASQRLTKATAQQQGAEHYRRYAEMALNMARLWDAKRKDLLTEATARTNAALTYTREAGERLANLRGYIEQALGYARIADSFTNEAMGRTAAARAFIEEATQRLNIADRWIAEAVGRVNSANGYINEASQRLAIADRWIAEASGRLNAANGYIAEANGRLAMSTAYINEAAGRMGEIDRYMAEAAQYVAIAGSDRELADRYRAEGIERRNEFWSILKDKAEYRKRIATVPVLQPA